MLKREEEQLLAHPQEGLDSQGKMLYKQLHDIDAYRLNPEDESPAVYCGTYRKYNQGSLFGAWIDLTACYDYEEFLEVCHHLHADESEPELMFQDFQYFPDRWYSEGAFNEEKFNKITEWWLLDDKLKEPYERFMWIYEEEDIAKFKEAYAGRYSDMVEFAKELVPELYPEVVKSPLGIYFDYQKFADDYINNFYTWDKGYMFKDNV